MEKEQLRKQPQKSSSLLQDIAMAEMEAAEREHMAIIGHHMELVMVHHIACTFHLINQVFMDRIQNDLTVILFAAYKYYSITLEDKRKQHNYLIFNQLRQKPAVLGRQAFVVIRYYSADYIAPITGHGREGGHLSPDLRHGNGGKDP